MNAYDEVLYPSYTHPQTHPDRLAVIGTIFGMKPAPVTHCRVLELGCGNGSNLVPMAWSLPESEFVGIDLAERPVAAGQQMIVDLGMKNIRLVHGDIMQISAEWGRFDYILAHGLYSWVPAPVRDQLLAICQQCLAPQGIAFVSYNALPGAHLRLMLREMMQFHVRRAETPDQRVQQARALARFLAGAGESSDPYRVWMKSEWERILENEESHLFHDDLAEVNEPVYFTRFIEHAARHGLKYVGEADYFEMSDHFFPAPVREALTQLGGNRILKEQYLDFLKCRRFRQTLLCRHDTPMSPTPQLELTAGFQIVSTVTGHSTAADLRPGVDALFESVKGTKVETDLPLGKAALLELEASSPIPLPISELLARTTARLQQAGLAAAGQQSEAALRMFLLEIYAAGAVEFRTTAPAACQVVSERPVASPIVRWQTRRGTFVTSLFHQAVQIEDELGRQLLMMLDGTRDHAAMEEELLRFLKSKGAISEQLDEAQARATVSAGLKGNLAKLARLGLLVG